MNINNNKEVILKMANKISSSNSENNNSSSKKSNNKIKIEKLDFPVESVKTVFMTVEEVCKMVSSIFKETLSGYIGCKPELNHTGKSPEISISLSFKASEILTGKNKSAVIFNSSSGSGDSYSSCTMYNKLLNINENIKANKYRLNKIGKDILSDFCKNPDKLQIIEKQRQGERILEVKNISLEYCISFIYGRFSKDLGKLVYTIQYTSFNDVRRSSNGGLSSVFIQVTQLNEKELKSMQERTGHINIQTDPELF